MNKLNILFCSFVLLFFGLQSYSQDLNNFEELQSTGNLPDDFVTLLSEKYDEAMSTDVSNEKWKSKRQKKQFYLESNYSLNEFIASGSLLFNDPLTNYLNNIYLKIENANPELDGKSVRFYTSKSPIVNAFATHSGVIFFNVGLIAKIKTEDELAYIMCHELAHFVRGHSMKQYTYNEEIDSERGEYKKTDWETKMFSKANYSQQHELEADSLGLLFYLNTEYNPVAAKEALGNLETYYLPFESKANFNSEMFDNENISYGHKSVVKLRDIKIKEFRTNDNLSTHPQIDERISTIDKLVKDNCTDSIKCTLDFIPNRVREIAKFEICHLFLERGMTMHAVYCALALLNEYPNNPYLNKTYCKIIYAISQNETYFTYSSSMLYDSEFLKFRKDYKNDLKYSAKEIQQVASFIDSLSSVELNELAITGIVEYNGVFDNSTCMDLRISDLVSVHASYYEKSDTLKSLIESNSKLQVVFQEKEKKTGAESDEDSEVKEDEISKSLTENKNNSSKKEKKKLKNQSYVAQREGIDKILIVSPDYMKFDLRKENSYRYRASDKALLKYQDRIKLNADKVGLEFDLLTSANFRNSDVSTINDIALVHTFITEKSYTSPITMFSGKEKLNELIDKYETDKLAFVGAYSFHLVKPMSVKLTALLWTGIWFPTLPIGIWYAFSPSFRTFNYAVVIDMKEEVMIFDDIQSINMNGGEGVINSNLYYNFLKIKKGLK